MKAKTIIFILVSLLMCWSGTQADDALKNRRVGIFSEEGFPGGAGARPAAWYTNELTKLGDMPMVLSAEDMSNAERLNRKALDVLILPDGKSIPYEAAYLIPKFLAEGGHVITTRLPRNGYRNNSASPSKWTEAVKAGVDLQLRFLRWESAQRSLKTELTINTNLNAPVREGLPPTVAPLDASIGLPDKGNCYPSAQIKGKREIRDFDSGGGNVETAGNIILPVYCLPSGEPTDFLAYRYHNNYYNGSTLVHLGQVGEALMKGDKAGDVLRSCLKLCEEKYPGEQSAEWYGRLIEVQRKTSEYGKVFVESYYKVRDGMLAAFYKEDEAGCRLAEKKLRELANGLEMVMKEKQAIDKLLLTGAMRENQAFDQLLLAGADPAGQDQRRQALLDVIAGEERACREAEKDMGNLLAGVKPPEKVKVKDVLGGMPVEAGVSWLGLYALRTDMFQTMKELGANVWYPQLSGDYYRSMFFETPQAKPLMDGISLDVLYPQSSSGGEYRFTEVLSLQGELDLTTGKVKETPRKERHPENLEKAIKTFVESWTNYPVIRHHGNSGESGLHCSYWGEQAREEYIEHLKGKYGEIGRLNERWLTAHKNFNDIKLITRRPETESEHANWEDWRKFREMQLFKARETAYKLFKKYAPNTIYSSCISTGVRYQPMYGVDYYELTKIQDISGIDGTAIPASEEWTYLDLNAGKHVWTIEWGCLYFPPPDMLIGRKAFLKQLWQETSGGHIGINCWFWRVPGFQANFVDVTGLPTLYGWELKQLAAEFRNFEHILLDGRRADPEIMILFSNTTKNHDAKWGAWGAAGEKLFSKHLKAVDNLYDYCLRLKLTARVLDEGALLDGADLSKCRLLIVPQAQYLSRNVQEKLVDYARNGGRLIVEGWSGKYDNYGNGSNSLFKTLGVTQGTVRTKEAQLPDDLLYLTKNEKYAELFYAPMAAEGAKTILKYASGEPAVISLALGKGKAVVSGLPFGLEPTGMSSKEGKAFGLIMGEILKEAGITPKYQCDDEALILREWEYGGELYLICAYPAENDAAKYYHLNTYPIAADLVNRCQLKIRGEWDVEDYLLGLPLPVKQDGGYTVLEGMMLSSGGRVYHLKPAKSGERKLAGKETGRDSKRQEKELYAPGLELPYQGEIFEKDGEVEIGGYKFQVTVVTGGGAGEGKIYLAIRSGNAEQKMLLEPGRETLFVFGAETLRVMCAIGYYVYPEGAKINVEKTGLNEKASEK